MASPHVTPVRIPFVAPVAGVSFRQQSVRRCAPNDPVVIVWELDNPHDEHACAVRTPEGELLGFIPAGLNRRLLAGGGERWTGTIAEVLAGGDTWGLRVRVERMAANPAGAQPRTGAPVSDPAPAAAVGAGEEAPTPDGAASTDPRFGAAVFAKSGRKLGVYVEQVGSAAVRVRDGERVMLYPTKLVTVDVEPVTVPG